MAIENNLPKILDNATHYEDGLMSFQDKRKLDSMDYDLSLKLDKTEQITADQIPAEIIEESHLSPDVISKITGQTPVSDTIGDKKVTTRTIADNAVTIQKLDKKAILANIISPKPINFAFTSTGLTMNVPKGTLLVLDTKTTRDLVYHDTPIEGDDTVALSYPTDGYTGLNYIVCKVDSNGNSSPMQIINAANHGNDISSTTSVIALVYIEPVAGDVDVSIVMNANYTINGLAQGIGTVNAALIANDKIVLDGEKGFIDFSYSEDNKLLYLIIGGISRTTIDNPGVIQIPGYIKDLTYALYWNNTSNALEVSPATIENTSTDINKIALIKDGRIFPYINTGIFYSKKSADSVYYNEYFDNMCNISISSKNEIDILKKQYCKLIIPEDTYVCLNQESLKVANSECFYSDIEGLHYILFDVDSNEISCRHTSEEINNTKRTVIIGTLWVNDDNILVSGNFNYTIDGKKPYDDDLSGAINNIKEIKDNISSDLLENEILSIDEVFMINGLGLPIYESSMLIKTSEGIKSAISYNKDDEPLNPKTEFFDGNISLDNSNGKNISLLAYDKYNKHSYLKKDIKVNKVDSNRKNGQNIKILCIGDNLINATAGYIKSKLVKLGVVPEMLGTQINSQVYGEGRDGWFYSTFVGASGRALSIENAEITTPTNPFVRVSDADDRANNPNDCYLATGAYVEKTYYNAPNKNDTFYIYDFAKYLETQGIATPDVIIIAIKPELVSVFTEDIVSTNMKYMQQMINGIRTALPDTHIGIIPQYGACTVYDEMWKVTSKMIEETKKYVTKIKDDNVKIIPAWLHMNREFGTVFKQNGSNTQLYEEYIIDQTRDQLSETAKIELANSIVSYIMNI